MYSAASVTVQHRDAETRLKGTNERERERERGGRRGNAVRKHALASFVNDSARRGARAINRYGRIVIADSD